MREAFEWDRVTMTDFAQRLRAARTERKLTQARLAELLGVNPRVYNRWEQGLATPHFDTAVKVADLLNVSLDELAGRAEISSEPVVHNHELHELVRQVDELADEDQRALIILMDSLLKRSQMTKVLSGRRRRSA